MLDTIRSIGFENESQLGGFVLFVFYQFQKESFSVGALFCNIPSDGAEASKRMGDAEVIVEVSAEAVRAKG